YKGKGCEKCKNTGYLGRSGIFELLVVEPSITALIDKTTNSQKIKSQARKNNMITLRDDGLNKTLLGITTIEEVLRVTHADISL
ncbi:general secretion pathway protein E, partial [Candidatus Magnetoovum chiemensis]